MTVAARPQRIVIGARGVIMLNAGPRPVIQRLPQPPLTGVAHVDEEGAFAAAFGDGRSHNRDRPTGRPLR